MSTNTSVTAGGGLPPASANQRSNSRRFERPVSGSRTARCSASCTAPAAARREPSSLTRRCSVSPTGVAGGIGGPVTTRAPMTKCPSRNGYAVPARSLRRRSGIAAPAVPNTSSPPRAATRPDRRDRLPHELARLLVRFVQLRDPHPRHQPAQLARDRLGDARVHVRPRQQQPRAEREVAHRDVAALGLPGYVSAPVHGRELHHRGPALAHLPAH